MKNTRKGMGKGLGTGYKNIAPMDAHIHSLSAKGVVTYKKTKSGGDVRVGTNKDGTKNYLFFPTSAYAKERPHQIRTVLKKIGLNARSSMQTIQLDPEHSVVMYSEGTRNGFRHVAILMHNGYEQEKASVSYLNRTWESYEFQTVLNKLFEKAFDKTKAKILMEDLDKKGGRSLMAKGVDADELKNALANFTGTEQYHKVSMTPVVATDGVAYLCEKAGAFWLVDAIGSYQTEKKFKDEHFQVWILKKDKTGKGAVLSAYRDYSEKNPTQFKPLVTQKIEYTDFPLDKIKLYEIDGVVLLPSEY